MRKILLILLAALLVAVGIYSGIGADNYFLLRIGDWAIQMRLFVAILLIIAVIVCIGIFWRIFRGVFLGAWPKAWRKTRQKHLTTAALENLALSNWGAARKELVRLGNQSDNAAPLILIAARSSENMGDYDEAKAVYRQALIEFPKWSYPIRMRLCDIALVEADVERAEELLQGLKAERPSDSQLLILEAKLAEEKRDWGALQNTLLASLKKQSIQAQIAPIERRYLYSRLLEKPGAGELLQFLQYVNTSAHVPANVIADLARQLAMKGHAKDAESLTKRALSRNWDDSLMRVYSELEAQSPKKQLKVAEAWLPSHADSTALLEGLQKLSVRAGDDAKADMYMAKLEGHPFPEHQALEKLPNPSA